MTEKWDRVPASAYGQPVESAEPDYLMHLVLTWADNGYLSVAGGWRDRHVARLGDRVSVAVQLAVSTLEAKGLVSVGPRSNLIRATPAGRMQLAEWDIQVAGVAEPVAPTAHTPTCLDDQE